MTLNIEMYVRKPQEPLEAVEVTAENINAVAAWCKGELRTEEHKVGTKERLVVDKYIKINVQFPRNERQTKAYIGDRILRVGLSFKVYMPIAFANSFVKAESVPELVMSAVENDPSKDALVELFTTTNNLVDLNSWAPGEDVDNDALIMAELKSYRRDLAELFSKKAQ